MPIPLKELLPSVVRRAGRQQRALARLEQRWRKAVGRQLAGHTQLSSLRRGTLYVRTDDAGTSFLLSLDKPRLLAKLRQGGGRLVVEDVVIRIGELSVDGISH